MGSKPGKCVRAAAPPGAARVVRALTAGLAGLWIASASAAAFAQSAGANREQLQSLDEQVQEIKSDVLRVATELDQLEEKLLHPSSTQVAVFVSMPAEPTFRLDSVSIEIDGETVARHIYSFKELEALKKGGVQRIYTGNVRTGEHKLGVSVAGKSSGDKDVAGSASFAFNKDVGPKLVGVTLGGSGSGDVAIELGGW
jgi:hypothetical protein